MGSTLSLDINKRRDSNASLGYPIPSRQAGSRGDKGRDCQWSREFQVLSRERVEGLIHRSSVDTEHSRRQFVLRPTPRTLLWSLDSLASTQSLSLTVLSYSTALRVTAEAQNLLTT